MTSMNKPRALKASSRASQVKTRSPRSSKNPARPRRARSSNGPMVGLAPLATNIRQRQRVSSSADGHSCRFRGTDFVQAVSSGSGLVAGQVLIDLPANPRMIGVSRLAVSASVWERFKFRSLKFHYAPIANATQTGSLIGYVDYDVNDAPTGTGDANLQRAWAHYGQQSCQIWGDPSRRTSWELKDIDPLTDLYIDAPSQDPHWTSQGRFVLLSASTVAAGLPLGNVFVEYDVEYFIPQLEASAVSGFASSFTGTTTGMSASAPWGTSPTSAAWNNTAVTLTNKVITLPAGSYFIGGFISGTVLAIGTTEGFTTTGTKVVGYSEANAAATVIQFYGQYYSDVAFTLTTTFTATTITSGRLWVCLLPTNALTLQVKRARAISELTQMLKECGKEEVEQKSRDAVSHRELAPVPLTRDYPSTALNSPMCSTSSASNGVSSSISNGWFRA